MKIAIKMGAVFTCLFLLASIAALNLPAILGSILVLNFLLGRLEVSTYA